MNDIDGLIVEDTKRTSCVLATSGNHQLVVGAYRAILEGDGPQHGVHRHSLEGERHVAGTNTFISGVSGKTHIQLVQINKQEYKVYEVNKQKMGI